MSKDPRDVELNRVQGNGFAEESCAATRSGMAAWYTGADERAGNPPEKDDRQHVRGGDDAQARREAKREGQKH